MSDRDMRRLIKVLEKKLGLSWADITEWLRGQNALDAVAAKLEAGEYASAIADVGQAAERFAKDLQTAFVEAGDRTAKWLDNSVKDRLIQFDQTNDRAVLHARRNKLELVRGFTEEQRTITRNVIADGLSRGANPREMARDLRDSIGLTDKQNAIVMNYRRSLENGDLADALRRQLRDARFDRMLKRLRREGEAPTPKQIDRLVERYRSNMVNRRAETIARTEALGAAHAGHDEAIDQAVERGDIDRTKLKETWHAGPKTKHARDDHQAMDEVSVNYGEDFELPDGTRMRGPGDRRGGAKHNASCRCAKSTSFAA